MGRLIAEVHRRDALLSLTGWAHLALALPMLVGLAVDERLILGINPWMKPLKFALSDTIYVWTVAYLLGDVRATAPRPAWLISRGVALAMATEIVCIAGQSWRGVPSHFQVSAPFDGAVFGLMGLMILLNTMLVGWLLLLYWCGDLRLPRPQLWGARLGLLVFLAGSSLGALMIGRNAHAVGVPDGGPGLPILNWSTEAGDLRPAHALGLHGLQVLPLLGWAAARARRFDAGRQTGLVLAFAVLYVLITGLLLHQALAGRPLLAV